MSEVHEVAENIYLLETHVPGIDMKFSAYLIHEKESILIEPGPTSAISSIIDGMKFLGIHNLSYIIPTHIHMDHAGGIGNLIEIFPSAKVILHPKAVKHMLDPSRLIEGAKFTLDDATVSKYGSMHPVPKTQIVVPDDEECVNLVDRFLQVFYAAGHAPHHIAILDTNTRLLFCGEALSIPLQGEGLFLLPTAAPPDFDMEIYLGTMERLKKLRPIRLAYSHDGVRSNPDELIENAVENTRIIGDMILKSLKNGESLESVDSNVRAYIGQRTCTRQNDFLLQTFLDGYAVYFKRSGMI